MLQEKIIKVDCTAVTIKEQHKVKDQLNIDVYKTVVIDNNDNFK